MVSAVEQAGDERAFNRGCSNGRVQKVLAAAALLGVECPEGSGQLASGSLRCELPFHEIVIFDLAGASQHGATTTYSPGLDTLA